MTPKVSVIVPVYNVAPYLRCCVDSVCAQTLKDIEIILVDDGSTDDCPSICDDYAAKDSRVKVIHKENGGPGDARNAGMKIMSGEYAGFIDSDDRIDEAMFEVLYTNAKKHEAEVSFCNFARVTDGEVQPKILRIETDLLDLSGCTIFDCFYKYIAKTHLPYNVSTGIFKTSYLKDYHLVFADASTVFAEDTLFFYQVCLSAKRFACTDELFYYYLSRQGSLTNDVREERRLTDTVSLFQALYTYTRDNRHRALNSSPADVLVFFWEFWTASLHFYSQRNGKEDLPPLLRALEPQRFVKTAARSFLCGKANRKYAKLKSLSPKLRLHLRLMALHLLLGKYDAFVHGYI